MGADPLDPRRIDRRHTPGPDPVRLDQLARHHPPRRTLRQDGARRDDEHRPASAAEVAAIVVAGPDVRQQAGEHRLVHAIRMAGLDPSADAQVAGDLAELAEQILPLTHTQVMEKLGAAQPSELVPRQRPLLLAEVVPQGDDRQQVAARDVEATVQGIGGLALLFGTLARVLDRQCRGDHEHLTHAPVAFRLEHHPPEPGVDREASEPAADLRERAILTNGSELIEQQVAIAYRCGIGWLEEGERGHVAEAEGRHLQDDRRQVRTQDLRLGELRAGEVVLLGVHADARAGCDPAAPSGPLVRRRPRDRLDGQSLHLQPAAVARDARRPGVDDGVHGWHGDRRLGDVGRQHDASATVRLEDAVLLDRRQAGVQRQHLCVAELAPAEEVGGVVDLPLAGEEHEHVSADIGELVDGVADRLDLVTILADGSVAHIDRMRAPGDLDHRRIEVVREASGVDRRRRDDHLQVRAPRQQLVQVAEQEVDVEAALVGLVDDDRVVAPQVAVALQGREQDPIGHHADPGVLADAVVEAHREADDVTDHRAQLLGDALGDGSRGDPARLGVADQTMDAAPEIEAQLR